MTTTTPASGPDLRSGAEQRTAGLATFTAGGFVASCQIQAAAREAEAWQNG